MKTKILIVTQSIIILVLAALLITRFISIGTVKPVVREPDAPGESALTYKQPPPPKLSVDVIRKLKAFSEYNTPVVDKITDRIYLARGFALGNVGMVITDDGLVIIDTTESREAAKKILAEFRKITDLPIRYIIYTHSHRDHILGASIFLSPGVDIIATEDEVAMMDAYYGELRPFVERSRANQSGRSALEYARKKPGKSPFISEDNPEYIRPTITFDETYTFELGGITFDLFHTMGETPDHLAVWLPKEKVLFSGDLYYLSFPNLSSPMLESRPVKEWYENLDRMIALKPDYLVPGHSAAVIGRDDVRTVLEIHSRAIKYVYDETINAINQGLTVDEAVAVIHLPPKLAEITQLQEFYGRVDWAVRGIYRKVTGWYDGHGSGLTPLPPEYTARETVLLAGGADKILKRAIELQNAGEHQLVCELCDLVIRANPKDKTARVIKAVSLDYLAYLCGNLNMFGFYWSAASLERQAAGIKP